MGRGPWSRVTGCIKQYAPSRIIYIILNRLQKAVSQKVILSWLIFDILVSIGLLVFTCSFVTLRPWDSSNPENFGWSVLLGCCSCSSAFQWCGIEGIKMVKRSSAPFWSIWFFSSPSWCLSRGRPFPPSCRLVCDCRTGTWAQCNAAQSFKYPEGARYNPYRPMPIDEDQKREELGPDTRMQKAEPPDILYVLRPPRSSSLLQEVASQEPSLRLPKRLLGKNALHQAGKQQSMLMLDAPDEPKESKKSKEPENPTEAENSKPENPTEPENSKPENPTEPENSKPENPTEPVNSKGPGKSEEPAKTKESEDTPRNISKACRDVFPKGIPETLTADDLAALNDLPVLLDLRQSLPEKVTQDLDEAEQQKITELLHELCDEHMGTLGLMPKAENKAETEKQALYMTDLIELNAGEQVKALDQHFRRTCRCEGHSSCNWYSYGAHMTMWCYVAESSVPWCHLEGIQLFKDTKNKTWTVDLCQEGSCKCAGLGMPAEDEDTVDADNPLIQKNPIYYGYKCGKWRNGDTLSWCWAGMDSSCFNRDRPLPPDYKTSNWPKGMLYMFRSVEPCSNNNLGQGPGGRLEPALQLCEYLQVSLEIFMYLYLICMFPMGGIIFKFICNRCGDAIQTEHQFQAYDTSEDSDDVSGAAAEPPGSSGAPGAAGGAGGAPARDSFTAWEGSR